MKLTEETILKLLRNKANRPMKVSELVKQFSLPDDQRRERVYMKININNVRPKNGLQILYAPLSDS